MECGESSDLDLSETEVLTKMDGSFWPPLRKYSHSIPLKPVGEKDINSC